MWTPRRIVLMLVGVAGFTAAFVAYDQALGGVDGLPALPARYLDRVDVVAAFEPSEAPVSPTVLRLIEAFGPASPEVTDPIAYKTKLELRDKGMVFACGQPVFSPEPSEYVTVAPFSVAMFGKPRPAPLRSPGEVTEISTFHADKAVLQFDRPVRTPQDLTGKAKLVGMELVSTPDTPSADPRKGRIWVTNNQRSADAGQFLVFRTPGPLFYRDPNAPGPKPSADAPQVWCTAAVEVIDRRNLPRPLRSQSVAAVPSRPDDLRGRNAVANILLGLTLPPPTVTAEGLKIYLAAHDPKAAPGKKNATGFSGVRRIELAEKVQMNLWTDGGAAFPGGGAGADAKPATPADPPPAATAVAGGLADAAAVARLFQSKTLLVIETLGPFRYDLDQTVARFEAAPAANPAVPNHVTVTRLSARGAMDNLFCKTLEVEFADPKATPAKPPSLAAAPPAAEPGGMKIKKLTALGDHVFLSVEAEQLLAQGTELHYDVDAAAGKSVTRLVGTPVVAVRERNRLQGGDPNTRAEVFLSSVEPAAGSKDKKRTETEVRGPGRMELFDPASNDNTLQASWGTSLVHKKDPSGGKELDLLTFDGGGTFADTKGGMKLSADRLQLWLAQGADGGPKPAAAPSAAGRALPDRLVAVGNVDGHSAEAVIRKTDQLTVAFRDVPPPPPEPAPVTAKPAATPPPADKPADQPKPPPAAKPAEKPKNPMYISARVVDATVARHPQPADAAGKPGGLKYQMERARCEDRVMVHQDPADPKKSARGVDIYGTKLFLDQQAQAGSVMTVHGGTLTQPAQVYFEDMALFGPVVVIDQPNNAATVKGRGLLKMPSSSDLAGGDAGKASEIEIQWADGMQFEGAMGKAEFLGQVHAVQQPRPDARPKPGRVPAVPVARGAEPPPDPTWTSSKLTCHRLDVTFDRPIYFNQLRKADAPNQPAGDKAKLRTALCTPVPDDDQLPDAVRTVTFLQETFRPDGAVAKAQRVTARQISVDTDDREQRMAAAGPGEVRIVQPGAKDPEAEPPQQPGGPPAKQDDQEMKLTVVVFPAQMKATDQNKVFQKSEFPGGAEVVQVPGDRLDLPVEKHQLPERGVYLSCSSSLDVSTTRTNPRLPPKQNMTAVGNARFETDKYLGQGSRIAYDTDRVVIRGGSTGQAELYNKKNGLVDRESYTTGDEIIRKRDGTVTGSRSGGGSINTSK